MSRRVTFATRLGAIAATVGSAVGLGNIWRFPYEAGQNGGRFKLAIQACVVFCLRYVAQGCRGAHLPVVCGCHQVVLTGKLRPPNRSFLQKEW